MGQDTNKQDKPKAKSGKRKYELGAAIDVGSTSLTLKIAELRKSKPPRVVETVRGSLALGRDTYNDRVIHRETLGRCCEILDDFRLKLLEYGIKQKDCPIVATSAVREAGNIDYVLANIDQKTGFKVRVLDNSVERFKHLSSLPLVIPGYKDLVNKGLLVVDIGSGSIQISYFYGGALYFSHNLLLGALRVNEMMDQLMEQARNPVELLDEYISCELDDFHLLDRMDEPVTTVVGLGATSGYLRRLCKIDQPELPVSPAAFQAMLEDLAARRPLELTTKQGVPGDLADLLLPAAMILKRYVSAPGVHQLYLSDTDLCDNLLLEKSAGMGLFKSQAAQEEDILSAAWYTAKRFRIDEAHTSKVIDHSMELFDVLNRSYQSAPRSRLYLQVAGILHDSGKFVQMNHHARQSFDLIRNLDLIGLDQRERLLIAYIARFHSARWAPQESDMEELNDAERRLVLRLASILRLADGLDATHQQKLGRLKPVIKGNTLTLHLKSRRDIMLEVATVHEKGALLSKTFGLDLDLVVQDMQG